MSGDASGSRKMTIATGRELVECFPVSLCTLRALSGAVPSIPLKDLRRL